MLPLYAQSTQPLVTGVRWHYRFIFSYIPYIAIYCQNALHHLSASADSARFYYDKTHKGNDWQAVKSRLSADIVGGKKSEVKATEEMLALLNDKYTRYRCRLRGKNGGGGGRNVVDRDGRGYTAVDRPPLPPHF